MRARLLLVGWITSVVLAFLTLLRFTHLDVHAPLFVAATTGAPILLLLAWPLTLLALGLQERWLALLGIVLILVDLTTMSPLIAGGRQVSAGESTPLRVFELNVLNTARTGAAVARQVRAANPDVVVLSELSYLSDDGLDLDQFRYSSVHVPIYVSGSGIWSRYPISDGGTRLVGGQPMTTVVITLPTSQHVTVLQVHTQSPRGSSFIDTWQAQLADLRREISAAHGLTIMAGDFNASRSDNGFARLLQGTGFADAADGRGLLPTWPSGKSWIWPVLRLDHVLVSRGIGVHDVRVLGPTGSDHRAVVADLML